MKKLLAVDLDGTLLDENHMISQANLDAISMYQARGGSVVVVTGRNLRAAQSFAQEVSPHLPLVCFNGAYILDPSDKKVLKSKALDQGQVADLIAIANKHGVHYRYYDLETIYAPESQRSLYSKYEGDMGPQMQYFSKEKLESYFLEAGLEVPKFVLHSSHADRLKAARQELDQASHWAVAQSWSGLVEVMPKGVNKGIALSHVCDHLKISLEDTVAVGDQENDSAMIEEAGLGIAVGNAAQELKEIADAVTVSNQESAIAHVIKTYCLEE